MDKKQMQEFIDATGLLAETSLLFYRNLIETGANVEEVQRLTRIFVEAILFGKSKGTKLPENEEN